MRTQQPPFLSWPETAEHQVTKDLERSNSDLSPPLRNKSGTPFLAKIISSQPSPSEVRENQGFLRAAFDGLSGYLAIADSQGQIVAINSAWRQWVQTYGVDDQDSYGIGEGYFGINTSLSPRAMEVAEGIQRVLTDDLPTFNIDFPCLGPPETWLRLTASAFHYDGRTWVMLLHEDITKDKRAEEDRKQLERQLKEIQKLESLGILAGGVAHEFNNLLVGMLLNTGLAYQMLNSESPIRENLEGIERLAQRGADLCRQMLAYSGRGKFVIEPMNLSQIAREMSNLLQASVIKNARLVTDLPEGLPDIEADITQIHQVFMELATNASEALDDNGGTIHLSTGVTHCSEKDLQIMSCENLPAGNYAFVEVRDDGCGMTPANRKRMFDPFFTTKFTGRGLGLAAVLGILRGHRGAIRVQSVPREGTTITLFFPALAPSSPHLNAVATSAPCRLLGTILVVDDEETIRKATKEACERIGLKVEVAADGHEALQIMRDRGQSIDLVLLDICMPGLSGEETLRRLRLLQPQLPVILTSGYTQKQIAIHLNREESVSFLQKPWNLRTLLARLQETLPSCDPP